MGRIKTLDEIKAMVRARTGKRNTFRHAKREDIESVLAGLTSKDPELWAQEWSRVAKPYEDQGDELEKTGKFDEARQAYLQAYAYYATGRYPTPHTPGKLECFHKSLQLYEKAGRYFSPPLERVEIASQIGKIPIYARVPKDGKPHAIVINFGGIDSFKAESYEYDEGLQRAGLASCAVDMPGVGECPIKASPSGAALFSGRSIIWRRAACRSQAHRDHGPQLRRLLGRQDGPRGSEPLARGSRLGRRHSLFFPGGLAARVDQRCELFDGPRHRPLPALRRG